MKEKKNKVSSNPLAIMIAGMILGAIIILWCFVSSIGLNYIMKSGGDSKHGRTK